MHKVKSTYYASEHRFACLVMMVLLLWLTVCTPFAFAQQQEQKKTEQLGKQATDECANPLANTNEEKAENSINSFSEEYLHEPHDGAHHFAAVVTYYKCHQASLYIDFHPDLFSPPPEQL